MLKFDTFLIFERGDLLGIIKNTDGDTVKYRGVIEISKYHKLFVVFVKKQNWVHTLQQKHPQQIHELYKGKVKSFRKELKNLINNS